MRGSSASDPKLTCDSYRRRFSGSRKWSEPRKDPTIKSCT